MDSGARHSAVALGGALAGLIMVATVWAAIARIDQVVHARGQTVPSLHVQQVDAVVDGVLKEVHISEGGQVEKGDPLITLETSVPKARIASIMDRLASRRQEAAVANGVIRLLDEAGEPEVDKGERMERGSFEAAVRARRQSVRLKLQASERTIDVKVTERQSLREQVPLYEQQAEMLDSELETVRSLYQAGDVSYAELVAKLRERNEMRIRLHELRARIGRLGKELMLERARRDSMRAELLDQSYRERARARAAVAQLQGELAGLRDRVEHSVIRAPRNGEVNKLNTRTLRSLVKAGEEVATIVPASERVVVQARVSPDRIGFVVPGQAARIKFDAYDFTTYGSLEGKVKWIGADTVKDEKGNLYYPIHVESGGRLTGNDGTALPIAAGMTVTADIVTAERTVLAYLLKPILRGLDTAFSER